MNLYIIADSQKKMCNALISFYDIDKGNLYERPTAAAKRDAR